MGDKNAGDDAVDHAARHRGRLCRGESSQHFMNLRRAGGCLYPLILKSVNSSTTNMGSFVSFLAPFFSSKVS